MAFSFGDGRTGDDGGRWRYGSHGGCGIWSIIGLEMKFGWVDV